MRNFDYLKDNADFAVLYKYCDAAEMNQKRDPAKAALNCRCALEYTVKAIYLIKQWDLPSPYTLFSSVTDGDFVEYIHDDQLMKNLHYVRKIGNNAAHGLPVTKSESFFALIDIYHFVGDVLVKLGVISEYPAFDRDLVPDNPQMHIDTNTDSVPTPQNVAQFDGRLDTPIVKHPLTGISEAETRKMFIDMMLKEAGWTVEQRKNNVMPSRACIEIQLEGMPNAQGVGYADYVLFGADCRPLAVIEAKKTSVDPIVGRNQAKLYAECIYHKYGVRPVIYYTNGYETNIIDGLGYPSRKVYGFMTEQDLVLQIQKQGRADITDMTIDDNITNREYQKRAIKFVCERFNQKRRRSLIVMATGTGKTRVAISLVELLQRNNWIKNVLFLADRTALVRQAHKNFVKLLPHCTTCVLSDDKQPDMNARIMFSTYQTMINFIDKEEKAFSVGRFDLVIIDEAHRSVFGKFGAIFDYFDSLLVGLTATPREDIDKNTFDLLEMDQDDGNNFCYELQEAVNDHYLVNYQTLRRHTKILENGIKYKDLTEDQKRQIDKIYESENAQNLLDTDDQHCRDIDKSELFKYIYNTDTVDKVLQDLMENGLKIENGDKIGKTIIFAYNHPHAQLIMERFHALYPQYGDDYCQLIDYTMTYAGNLLEKFEVANQLPQIAVSVDMLDTGVDVPEILNLVFFKVIRSKIKFIQMIGRGTRLCPDIFGPGKDKDCFYIFDYLNNFEFFEMHTHEVEPAHILSLTERLFDVRTDIAVTLQSNQHQSVECTKRIHDELKTSLCAQVAGLKDNLINVRRNWAVVDKYRKQESWTYVSETDVIVIKDTIAPLLVQETKDESASKFDLIMLYIELSKIDESAGTSNNIPKVMDIASVLERKASVPAVRAKMDTIHEVQTMEFWDGATIDALERVRKELRDLIQLIDGKKKGQFTVDIPDVVSDGGTTMGVPVVQTYRQRVADYIAKNKDENPVLRKIVNIEPLTSEDMAALQHILWHELGSESDYKDMTNSRNIYVRNNVAAFVRTIMGIDRQKAVAMFTELISNNNLNSMQESFLKSIINYVCENGDITSEKLMDEPFSMYLTEGVFADDMPQIAQYVTLLHHAIANDTSYQKMIGDIDRDYDMAATLI
jgi:type I restriction enzyme R subunit